MRILATVDCSGAQVVMEVDAQGNLIFHNHDFEADMAAEALGFETTECLRLARGWEEAQSAIFIREFPLDGEVWFAVLVAWLEKIAWAYSSVMELAEGVGIELSVLPFEALATVQQHVTYGLTLSREETVALSDKIRELDRSLTGAISERLEDNYQENISSLIGAARRLSARSGQAHLLLGGLHRADAGRDTAAAQRCRGQNSGVSLPDRVSEGQGRVGTGANAQLDVSRGERTDSRSYRPDDPAGSRDRPRDGVSDAV